MTESVDLLLTHIRKHGPYDGIMGFSQGAAMATRIALLLESAGEGHLFSFLVLIGGVPPSESRFDLTKVGQS
jgi:thioesterase domain-containing protein